MMRLRRQRMLWTTFAAVVTVRHPRQNWTEFQLQVASWRAQLVDRRSHGPAMHSETHLVGRRKRTSLRQDLIGHTRANIAVHTAVRCVRIYLRSGEKSRSDRDSRSGLILRRSRCTQDLDVCKWLRDSTLITLLQSSRILGRSAVTSLDRTLVPGLVLCPLRPLNFVELCNQATGGSPARADLPFDFRQC